MKPPSLTTLLAAVLTVSMSSLLHTCVTATHPVLFLFAAAFLIYGAVTMVRFVNASVEAREAGYEF